VSDPSDPNGQSPDGVVVPWTVGRGACSPRLDGGQLQLQTADPTELTESVYTRRLVKFANSSLPAAINYSSEPEHSLAAVPFRLKLGEVIGTGVGEDYDRSDEAEPGRTAGTVPADATEDAPATPAGGTTYSGFGASPSRPPGPTVFNWDLFLMLKYRQDLIPGHYAVGDLLFSLSLMPNEELTLELKTWETSKTQHDEDDQLDQRNISDIKTTASTAAEVANRTEAKEHTGVDAKASYSGFGASVSVDVNWSQDVATMNSNQAKQAQERSQQETAEYKSSHKVRLSVSREQGSDEKSTRRIRNINQAHTLNANYYEILRQQSHELHLYDATLVLLGYEPKLNQVLSGWISPPQDDGKPGPPVTLAHLLRQIGDQGWIDKFIDKNGVSPLHVIYHYWARSLYTGALDHQNYLEADAEVTSEERELFRTTMLRYVRPAPGWIQPDEAGALRWAYELIPDPTLEAEALTYLYGFLPHSVNQLTHLVIARGVDRSSAYHAVSTRYAMAVQPSYVRVAPAHLRSAAMVPVDAAPPTAAENTTIVFPGLFQGARIGAELSELIARVVGRIKSSLDTVRGQQLGKQGEWTSVLPTPGVYADLSLGTCSGLEDYLEIQRQFDLERRRLENERLRLENELLEAGKPIPTIPTVTVENQQDSTQLNLQLALPGVVSPTSHS
jgi:hypothetical protein